MTIKILVPLDGSKVGESAIPYVIELASKLKSELQPEVILFHVMPQQYQTIAGGEMSVSIPVSDNQLAEFKNKAIEYLDRAGDHIRKKGINVVVKTAFGIAATAEEIVKIAEAEKVDIIAMSTHGRSGIGRWALGSVTDKVLHFETHIPIMVIRAAEK